MMKRLLLVFVLAAALGGCMPGIGGTTNSAKGTDYLKGGAVSGFPNLPFYQKAKVLETYGSGAGYGGSAITDDDISKVVEFYNKNLGTAGWEFNLRQKEANDFVFNVNNSQYQGVVIVNVASDGKKTAITLSVSKR
jgi:hypothetical protein